jgi:hypothetical protein
MAVLPGVLGCWYLRRTVQVRLGFDFGFRILDLGFCHLLPGSHELLSKFSFRIPQSAFRNRRPGGKPIFVVSRQQFMKYLG